MSHIESLRRAVDSENYQVLVLGLNECKQSNCDINAMTNAGNGLIHRAVNRGSLPIVELLIKYGADPNLLDNDEVTPLRLAAQYDDLDIVSFLLQHGAQIPHDLITYLIGSYAGDEIIEYLLKAGANVGSAKELVEEILSHQDTHYYEFNGLYLEADDYKRFRKLLDLLYLYDSNVKEPNY
jgi:ankyrin repeat protein